MTLPIRAFMMIRGGPDNWSVKVCRDFETVLDAWTNRADPLQTAILHIGFDRPPSTAFEAVAEEHPSRLLVTASTKFGLPHGYEASAEPIGFVENLPIHLGTRGWGYVVEEGYLRKTTRVQAPIQDQNASGWVASILELRPDLAVTLKHAGIVDDISYLKAESTLPREARYRLGLFRFRDLIKQDNDHDPCAIARAAPPWLEERLVETMDFTVRIANVFVGQGVKTVGDLQKFDLPQLLRIQNFGRKSANDLRVSLMKALDEGPFNLQEKIEKAGTESLRVELQRTLATLDDRERDILTRRMGFARPPQTLQAIADDYGVTRERIRQIESKVVERLIREAYWDDLLTKKLDVLLAGREFPLPVLGVEAIDKWFVGVSEWPQTLRYILANFCANRVTIIRIDNIDYLGFLQQEEWETALTEGKRILGENAGGRWTEDHCKAVVTPLIKENAREFREILWEKAAKLCNIVQIDGGQRTLISYGRGGDPVVAAVLSDAERPLHYLEIAERASERRGQPFDPRTAHNAAASIGILLARGTYGLEKHIELLPEDANLIIEQAENIILGGPTGRQWHAAEIFSFLLELNIPTKSFDKYVLDFLLRSSEVLQSLGRMIWVESNPGKVTPKDRIDIRQTIISLVQEAGRPLYTNEIHQRLVALRGMNETFLIVGIDPLIRIGTGLWGLNDRDLPIKRADQSSLIEGLVEILNKKNSGIHISEIGDLPLHSWPGLTPEMLFSIVSQDARMRVSTGQYLYLEAWGIPRRETPLDAVRHVMSEEINGLTLETITTLAMGRLQRELEKGRVSACLQTLGATFEPENGTWVLLAGEADQADEEDFAAEKPADNGRAQESIAEEQCGTSDIGA